MKLSRKYSRGIFIVNSYLHRLVRTLAFGIIILVAFSCKKDDNSNQSEGGVTDIDGNVYKTLKLGDQIWMIENLRVTRFRDGTIIETTEIPTQDITLIDKPNYQWAYEGNESLAIRYGRLYTYFAIVDTCGICPEGWRVPDDEDWTILTNFAGGEISAHKTLKEMGFNPQYGGIRINGIEELSRRKTLFNPQYGGTRIGDLFANVNQFGYFWSSTYVDEETTSGIISETQVYARIMVSGYQDVYRDYQHVKSGLSLRCIKEE